MIKVKFYGLLRLKLGIQETDIEAKTVKELLTALGNHIDGITETELKESVVFVNGKNMTELKMYRTKLNSGDLVLLMSPVSGG